MADAEGVVAAVTSQHIIITKDGELPEADGRSGQPSGEVLHVYELRKFMRSNAGTVQSEADRAEG